MVLQFPFVFLPKRNLFLAVLHCYFYSMFVSVVLRGGTSILWCSDWVFILGSHCEPGFWWCNLHMCSCLSSRFNAKPPLIEFFVFLFPFPSCSGFLLVTLGYGFCCPFPCRVSLLFTRGDRSGWNFSSDCYLPLLAGIMGKALSNSP